MEIIDIIEISIKKVSTKVVKKTFSRKSDNKRVEVHSVNIAHYRLLQLTALADQAKPFYDWVERRMKALFSTNKSLNDFFRGASLEAITQLIQAIYSEKSTNIPVLFDGPGRVYSHRVATFYFFAWIIRDAPKQRLQPLITAMRKNENNDLTVVQAETDALARLIYEYRLAVQSFSWESVREVFIDRLEGSRRSISGHLIEANVRSAVTGAIQTFFAGNLNYGIYSSVKVSENQVKIGMDTADVHVTFVGKDALSKQELFVPVKSRETQGSGHAHLFSRDIMTAILNIRSEKPDSLIAVVIIAENWDVNEIQSITDKVDLIFHFDMNPNEFQMFDEDAQTELNRFIGGVLRG